MINFYCFALRMRLFLLSIAFFALAACGGGGGSSSSSASSDLVISGVALTGTAIDAGAVQVKCQSGTGTTTTGSDGSFTVTVTGGARPCLLKVTDPISSTDIHSLLESGTVANISPVTDLVVSNTTGVTPSTAFTNYTTAIQSSITSAKVAQAITVAQKTTESLGTDADMTGIDPLKISIKARQGDTAGEDFSWGRPILIDKLPSSQKW